MRCSTLEALAQLARLGREGLVPPLLLQDSWSCLPSKNGAYRPTPPGMGVRDGRGMMEGALLSIQMLP